MRIKTRGAPRHGDLLLHGIAWCARCGHKMYVRYKGGGEYVCNHLRSHEGLPACQHIRASRVDVAVADAFLTALAPAELDALSRARRAQQQVDTALRTSAERELERKRYAAALAERQFNRVDPDNRFVAGELERRWEAALSEVRAAEEALARHAAPHISMTGGDPDPATRRQGDHERSAFKVAAITEDGAGALIFTRTSFSSTSTTPDATSCSGGSCDVVTRGAGSMITGENPHIAALSSRCAARRHL
ncbi:MAG: zinc ribbon domain-containing protein [Candidatus Gracilibacteria bacterium]